MDTNETCCSRSLINRVWWSKRPTTPIEVPLFVNGSQFILGPLRERTCCPKDPGTSATMFFEVQSLPRSRLFSESPMLTARFASEDSFITQPKRWKEAYDSSDPMKPGAWTAKRLDSSQSLPENVLFFPLFPFFSGFPLKPV